MVSPCLLRLASTLPLIAVSFLRFGFNAGSEGGMNLRSIQAAIVTQVAASMGGLTWAALDLCVSPLSFNLLCRLFWR